MSKVQGSVRPARARRPGSSARPAAKTAKPADASAAAPAPSTATAEATSALVRMGELSRLSGVPSSTIKHYLREGLLPGKSVSIARNSALYDRSLVEQIRHIKDLQTTHFLPLWRIKEVLAGTADAAVATVAAAVDRIIESEGSGRSEGVTALLQRGLAKEELAFLLEHGLIAAGNTVGGDDLALCETIIRARRAGLADRISSLTVLQRYRQQVEALVATEIAMFQQGIVAGAGDALAAATVEAMKVSERLVTLMRRRMLLPVFEAVARHQATRTHTVGPSTTPGSVTTKKKKKKNTKTKTKTKAKAKAKTKSTSR